MNDYDNTNKGAIWKNEDKQSETHPDFKGSLNVNGVEYWVSAWLRAKDANPKAPSLKFSIQPKERQEPQAQPAREPGSDDDFNDSIPF